MVKMCLFKTECADTSHRRISTFRRQIKNAEHTAQPHTLAAFLPWGSFAGAGRPARRKGSALVWRKKKN